MTGVKFPVEIQRRVDALYDELKSKIPGIPLALSGVLSQLVVRGLDVYERELGITAKKSKVA
jgi:hypothetical protein